MLEPGIAWWIWFHLIAIALLFFRRREDIQKSYRKHSTIYMQMFGFLAASIYYGLGLKRQTCCIVGRSRYKRWSTWGFGQEWRRTWRSFINRLWLAWLGADVFSPQRHTLLHWKFSFARRFVSISIRTATGKLWSLHSSACSNMVGLLLGAITCIHEATRSVLFCF